MEKQKLSALFGWGACGSIALAAVLQTLAFLLSYEPLANYFLIGAPLPYLAIAMTVIGALCGILFAGCLPNPSQSSPFSDRFLPSLPAAIGMLLCAILICIFTSSALSMVTACALLLAALYSVLCGSRMQKTNASALSILGFAAVIACALMNALYYFDTTLEMNAPIKVTVQTALLFAMLYYTAEIRYLLGRQKPRLFLALSMITLATSALSAIAIPITFACGIVTRTDCFAGALLTLGIAITVAARLYRTLTAKPEVHAGVVATDTSIPDNSGKEETEAE